MCFSCFKVFYIFMKQLMPFPVQQQLLPPGIKSKIIQKCVRCFDFFYLILVYSLRVKLVNTVPLQGMQGLTRIKRKISNLLKQ